MKNKAKKSAILLSCLGLLLCLACAHYPVNPPLAEGVTAKDYNTWETSHSNRSDELVVFLAFSGGGTRAAALSYGILKALDKIKLNEKTPTNQSKQNSQNAPSLQNLAANLADQTVNSSLPDQSRTLLDEVDIISSVSGGSFTASYYGLHAKGIFQTYEEKFLKKNISRALMWRILNPYNWVRFSSSKFGRTDMAAEYYDKILFKDAQFFDIMSNPYSPQIQVQATDILRGTRFSFSPAYFDLICSDFYRFPVSRAVAASAAFPVAFSPLTLRNYGGTCEFEGAQWVKEVLKTKDFSSRSYNTAINIEPYLDGEKSPFIHLQDGGIGDNLGVRNPLEIAILESQIHQKRKTPHKKSPEKIIFIVINAENKIPGFWGTLEATPGLGKIFLGAVSVFINNYNYDTLWLLKHTLAEWSLLSKREKPIDFYTVHISFNSLKDPEEKAFFTGLPTSLKLPDKTVDRLIEVSEKLLYDDPIFQKFVYDLNADLPGKENLEMPDPSMLLARENEKTNAFKQLYRGFLNIF